MSFFYDLNKKLDGIRATPEVTHKQLNERDMSRAAKGYEKYGKPGMNALRDGGLRGDSEKEMDAIRAKYDKYDDKDELNELSNSLVNAVASKRYANDKGRRAYYDAGGRSSAESPEQDRNIALNQRRDARQAKDGTATGLNKIKNVAKGVLAPLAPLASMAGFDEGAHSQDAMELNPDFAKIGQKPGVMDRVAQGAKKLADFVAPGDEELLNRGRTGKIVGARQPVKEKMSPGKAKSFAALAPPEHKITFADKIAGAKKEVDEMLGDVAAEAMKKALGGGRGREQEMDEASGSIDYDKVLEAIAALYGDDMWENDAMQDLANDLEQAGPTDRELDFIIAKGKLPKRLAGIQFSAGDSVQFDEASTGNAFDYKNFKQPEKQKPTSFVHKGTYGTEYDGDKEDAKAIRTKKQAAADAGQGSRGRGRPKKGASVDTGEVMKPDFSAFGDKVKIKPFAGKITKHKMVGEDDLDPKDQGEYDQEGDMAKDSIKTVVRHAQALEKILGDNDNLPEWVQSKLAKIESMMTAVDDYMQNQADDMDGDEEPIAEKAVSKKQQRFMGMVSAAKKGEKPASKEVAKVAKTMKKGDAEDFASTKHKGLPEKAAKKTKEKDVEESTTSGSVATSGAAPKAAKGAGGFTFGKGIYDSMNRELEGMIAESMSMNMSMNNDGNGPTRSLTITATDDDATKLAQLLKSAGLGGDDSYSGEQHMHEVSMNQPDYPTNTEQAEDNFEYPGGLNKPKRDVAGDGQTTVPVTAVHTQEQDALHRMMEMAGVPQDKMALDEVSVRQNSYATVGPNGYSALMQMSDTPGFEIEPDEETQMATVTVLPGVHPEASAAIQQLIQQKLLKPIADFTHREVGAVPNRPGVYEQDEIARMMEMAGVKKKEVDEEKTDEGNKFTGNLTKARADGKKEADLDGDGDLEKVRESIFTLTNQWKAYKG
jgi:hypothetical protein